jgi:hypothetical protein
LPNKGKLLHPLFGNCPNGFGIGERGRYKRYGEKGGTRMTVMTQVQTCLSSLKSAQASLESFALQTDNQQAKQLFQQAAATTQSVIDQLNNRVTAIQNEEPQYRNQ